MAYCTVDDVCSFFPRFIRGQAGSVSDPQIDSWCADGSTLVHAGFYQRGLDTDQLATPLVSDPAQTTPVTDQPQVLRELTVTYPTFKLGSAIWATLTAAEQQGVRRQYDLWRNTLERIREGSYDKLFFAGARTVDIQAAFTGVAGAETEPTPTVAPPYGSNRQFWKNIIW